MLPDLNEGWFVLATGACFVVFAEHYGRYAVRRWSFAMNATAAQHTRAARFMGVAAIALAIWMLIGG